MRAWLAGFGRRLLHALMLSLVLSVAQAQTAPAVPPDLLPWVPWVLTPGAGADAR
jgi:hypothetical protein